MGNVGIAKDVVYKDTGCHLYPSCLNCPREICIEDETGFDMCKKERDETVIKMHKQGINKIVIAKRMGLSRHTVGAICKRYGI